MLGPHIFGCCFVTRLQMAMMALQSASCSGLALEARYSSTLAPVGLVLVSAIGESCRVVGDGQSQHNDRTRSTASSCPCALTPENDMRRLLRRYEFNAFVFQSPQ